MSTTAKRATKKTAGKAAKKAGKKVTNNMTEGATEETIRFNGVDVFVRAVGAGPPILLINGLGAHTAMWETMEETLAGFRLIEFDLPGAGQSGVSTLPMSISDLAEAACAVMDHFGVERAHVLGYSMGGIVAQQLASDAPERVERLILLATTPGRGSFRGDIRAMINMLTPARYLSPTLYASTIGSMVGGRARHDTAWVADQGILRLRHSPKWRGYLWQLASVIRWSGFPILPNIEHEVLVLAGDDDPLIPVVNAMMLTYALQNGRLLVVRTEGHLMMMDPESRIHPAIREFFSAGDLRETRVWHHADRVDRNELQIALAGARILELPWGVDALMRRRWLRRYAAAQSE